MIYLLGIIILIICLWFVKVKLKVTKDHKFNTKLIISNLFKIKIDLEEKEETQDLKKVIEVFRTITNPLISKIFSKSTIEKVKVNLFIREDQPYLVFLGHMLLIELRKLCHKYFKKIKYEKFKIEFGKQNFNGEIIVSINLGKLVTIILLNYKSFKKLKLIKN